MIALSNLKFVSTVVVKSQIKAESKDIQHRLVMLVLLSNLQKFVGVLDFFIYNNVFVTQNYSCGYLISCFFIAKV